MNTVINDLKFGIPGFISPDVNKMNLISWQSDEKLCGISHYNASIDCDKEILQIIKRNNMCGRQAIVWMSCTTDDGKLRYRCMAGYIESIEITENSNSRTRIDIDMVSHPPLKFRQASAIYSGKSEYQLGQRIFGQSGGDVRHYCPDQGGKDSLKEINIPRDCLLQYQESDIDFLQRILWQRGLMYGIGLSSIDTKNPRFPSKPLRSELGLWTNFSQYSQGAPNLVLEVSEQVVSGSVGQREGVFNVRTKRIAQSFSAEATGINSQNIFQAERSRVSDAKDSGDEYLLQHYGRYVENRKNDGEVTAPLDVWHKTANKMKCYWDCDNPLLGLDRVVISGLSKRYNEAVAKNNEICVIGLKQNFKRGTNGIWSCTGAAESISGEGKWLPVPLIPPQVLPILQGIVVGLDGANNPLSIGVNPEADNRFSTDEYGRVDVRILGLDARTPDGTVAVGNAKAGVIRMRVMTPMAGTGHGMYMGLPEGTEVAVGFVDGDSQPPVVLGSFFGQKNESVNPSLLDTDTPGDWRLSSSSRMNVNGLDELVLAAGTSDANDNDSAKARITLNKSAKSLEIESDNIIKVKGVQYSEVLNQPTREVLNQPTPLAMDIAKAEVVDPWIYVVKDVLRLKYGYIDFLCIYINFSCFIWIGGYLMVAWLFGFYITVYVHISTIAAVSVFGTLMNLSTVGGEAVIDKLDIKTKAIEATHTKLRLQRAEQEALIAAQTISS